MLQNYKYKNGWERSGAVVSFPVGWQVPAKTEKWAWELLVECGELSPFVEIVCFPWATLVDLLRQGKQERAKLYLEALDCTPPGMSVRRATVCQHIYALDMLPYFKKIGITDIFWSHKTIGLNSVDGIEIHPFPLYPVMYEMAEMPMVSAPLKDREYLYSFVGSYQPDIYLTDVRRNIFNFPKRENTYILERNEWHFEGDVYRTQIAGGSVEKAERAMKSAWEKQYISIMKSTKFSLCPSGSGPNSIRFWESIKFGCIPVLLSNTLDLFGQIGLSGCILQIDEVNIDEASIYQHLQGLAENNSLMDSAARLIENFDLDREVVSLFKKIN